MYKTPEDDRREIDEVKDEMRMDFDTRILWVAIPIIVGGVISMFSNFQQDVQIIVWGIMFLIAMLGLWASNARKIRKRRERLESERWNGLTKKIDKSFDRVNERFDEIDKRFILSEATDKTLLRNEIIKMHREYCQTKGYITLQALEYVDNLHDQYNAVNGNKTGDKLWEEMHKLPVYDNEAVVPPEVRAKGADLCIATGEPYQTMHPGAA